MKIALRASRMIGLLLLVGGLAGAPAASAKATSDALVRGAASASFTEIHGDLKTLVACKVCPTELAIIDGDARRCMRTLNTVRGSTTRGEAGRVQAFQACFHMAKAIGALMVVSVVGTSGGDATVAQAEIHRALAGSVRAARLLGIRAVF